MEKVPLRNLAAGLALAALLPAAAANAQQAGGWQQK